MNSKLFLFGFLFAFLAVNSPFTVSTALAEHMLGNDSSSSAKSGASGSKDIAQSLINGNVIYNVDEDKPPGWRGSPQVSLGKLKQIGYIAPFTSYEGSIIDNLEHRDAASRTDIVFLDIKNANLDKGDFYVVLSKKRVVRHPVYKSGLVEKFPHSRRPKAQAHLDFFTPLGQPVGDLVEVVGLIEIIEVGKDMSKGVVRESYNDIQSGDMLVPFKEPEYPETREETMVEPAKEGFVLTFFEEKDIGGKGDITYIDLGRDHKVVPGDHFEVYMTPYQTRPPKWYQYRGPKTPLMEHLVGELQVVAVEKETATTVVVDSSLDLLPGYRVRFKPREEPIQLSSLKKLNQPPLLGISDEEKAAILEAEAAAERQSKEAEILENDTAGDEPFPMAGLQDALDKTKDRDKEAELLTFRPTTDLKDIHFPFDEYDLDDETKAILKGNAEYLKQHPDVKVQIQGHTDERGTNNYNLALGARRTHAIKQYLISLGVEEERMYVISYGEEQPFCMDSSETCWYENRRAHFMVATEEKDRF